MIKPMINKITYELAGQVKMPVYTQKYDFAGSAISQGAENEPMISNNISKSIKNVDGFVQEPS